MKRNLQKIKLGSNNLLRWEIPSEIGVLSGLITLDLYDNANVTGHIPSEVSARVLPNLRQVQLVGTGISGNLDSLCTTCTSTSITGTTTNDQKLDDNDNHATTIIIHTSKLSQALGNVRLLLGLLRQNRERLSKLFA